MVGAIRQLLALPLVLLGRLLGILAAPYAAAAYRAAWAVGGDGGNAAWNHSHRSSADRLGLTK